MLWGGLQVGGSEQRMCGADVLARDTFVVCPASDGVRVRLDMANRDKQTVVTIVTICAIVTVCALSSSLLYPSARSSLPS